MTPWEDCGFRSKVDCWVAIKAIRDSSPIGQPLPADQFTLLVRLLGHHPRFSVKVGAGVDAITVGHVGSVDNRTFLVHRVDGTMSAFSFAKCIRGEDKGFSSMVYDALWAEILPVIKQYKRSRWEAGPLVCAHTGDPMPDLRQIITRHSKSRPFASIVESWLFSVGIDDLFELEVGRVNPTGPLCLVDRDAAFSWRAFYMKKAKLELILRPVAQSETDSVGAR